MIRSTFVTMLALAAGCSTENYRSMEMAVTAQPAMVAGVASALAVPATCPIYTPDGGDIDTPEPPYTPPVHFSCGVDSQHGTYGLEPGDDGDWAILPGDRELGVYIDLDGAAPAFGAWSAPLAWPCICGSSNAVAAGGDLYPEAHDDAKIGIQTVATGTSGLLLSIGQLDDEPTQVFVGSVDGNGSADERVGFRFYVNARPGTQGACSCGG